MPRINSIIIQQVNKVPFTNTLAISTSEFSNQINETIKCDKINTFQMQALPNSVYVSPYILVSSFFLQLMLFNVEPLLNQLVVGFLTGKYSWDLPEFIGIQNVGQFSFG